MLIFRKHRPSRPPPVASSAHTRSQRGFTLVEMVAVVASLAILASVAIPQFIRLQLRVRRAEAFTNLNAIALAEIAYEKLTDSYIACSESPTTSLGPEAHPFDATQEGWSQLEWEPDGWVRCHYKVDLYDEDTGTWIRPTATCDLDGDGKTARWFLDVDPLGASSASNSMVLHPSGTTDRENRY